MKFTFLKICKACRKAGKEEPEESIDEGWNFIRNLPPGYIIWLVVGINKSSRTR